MNQQRQGWFIIILISLVQLTAWAIPKINHQVSDFVMVDTYGRAHQLSNYSNNIVVLEWTNHRCPFVKKYYQSNNMQKMQKAFTDQGVVWLSIISSAEGKGGYVSDKKANRLTQKRRAFPTAVIRDVDGKLGRQFGAKVTPEFFILGKHNKLVYRGAVDSIRSTNPEDISKAKPYVKQVLTSLLAGRSVKLQVTRPYGCPIKYAN